MVLFCIWDCIWGQKTKKAKQSISGFNIYGFDLYWLCGDNLTGGDARERQKQMNTGMCEAKQTSRIQAKVAETFLEKDVDCGDYASWYWWVFLAKPIHRIVAALLALKRAGAKI